MSGGIRPGGAALLRVQRLSKGLNAHREQHVEADVASEKHDEQKEEDAELAGFIHDRVHGVRPPLARDHSEAVDQAVPERVKGEKPVAGVPHRDASEARRAIVAPHLVRVNGQQLPIPQIHTVGRRSGSDPVSYTHLRAHETGAYL
eukprot:5510866-Pyramimonas_sp.AAC.1